MTPERQYLFALEQFGIKLGLDQSRGLVRALDHPDRAFRSLIVAGTNGKGSVTAMLERGLRAAGYRTGRYTSPHLVDLEERFAIDGNPVQPKDVDLAVARLQEAACQLPAPPSFFEATTAIAFDLFRDARVDVAVLEVGLGGRLDATNVADAEAAMITRIDFDHQQYLGDTIEAIAREKAGVIKPGRPVILSENSAAVDAVVTAAAAAVGAPMIRSWEGTTVQAEMREGHAHIRLSTPRADYAPMVLALAGRHQIANAVAAVRLLEELSAGSWRIPASAIRSALADVDWPARLESLHRSGISLLVDGAHNPAGARALADHVHETFGRPLPFVVGVMGDKDIDGILTALAPVASAFFFTASPSPRAAAPPSLVDALRRVAPAMAATAVTDPMLAVRQASTIGSPVVVAGSLFLAGEIRSKLS